MWGVDLGKDDVCLSAECVSLAAEVINSLNENVDPCDDFYHFASKQPLAVTVAVTVTVTRGPQTEAWSSVASQTAGGSRPIRSQTARVSLVSCRPSGSATR